MPVISVYHHGVTMGTAPSKNNHQRAKRSTISGWSAQATRNNIKFLRSIHPDSYNNPDEVALTFTLTLRTCPESSRDWHKMRDSFIKRLSRMGMTKLHWVTEWLRRCVPHLHGVVFLPADSDTSAAKISKIIKDHWLAVSARYGSQGQSQYIKPMDDAVGWFQYMAKHAARGVKHYQRSASSIPEGWQGRTGRVWGHCGEWQTTDAGRLEVDNQFFHKFRRIVRAWRKSDARSELKDCIDEMLRGRTVSTSKYLGSLNRISSSRRMLKCNEIKLSTVRGVSEWMPSNMTLDIAEFLVVSESGIIFDTESS